MTWSVDGVGLAYRHPTRADFPLTHRKMSRTRETSQTSAIERRLRDDGPAADDNGNLNVNDNAANENDCDTDFDTDTDIDTDIDTDTDIGTDTDSNINDDVDGQLASKRAMEEEIISQFPRDHIVHCFGYGSGVFSQSLSRDKVGVDAGMLDLIFVVGDTRKFHEENLQRFPHHYAPWLRRGGPDLATTIQRKGFPWLGDAHVLFHVVDAETDNHQQHHGLPKMKYGVVDKKDLVGDLVDWDSLYLAGRMHKPTLSIIANDDDVLEAQRTNLRAAMATALLLSSESESGSSSPSLSKTSSSTDTAAASSLSWPALYRQIAALSYTGDFRMQVGGEDPLKLDKLVRAPGQLQRFHGLYRPTLQSFERTGLLSTTTSSSTTTTTTMHSSSAGGIEWNPRDPSTISHLLDELPDSLRKRIGGGATLVDREVLVGALSAIVAPAARNQSFKGIFTLGFRKTLRYASAKLSKGLFARK